jgi:hypothetical protein
MHIEIELDDKLAHNLLRRQQNSNRSLLDIITEILADAVESGKPGTGAESQNVLQILERHQLLGCMEGDGNLSVDYKKHLWHDR